MSDTTAFRYGRTFDLFDANDNGVIGQDDIAALAAGITRAGNLPADSAKGQAIQAAYQRFWQVLSRHADTDSDGNVTREEFVNAMDNGMSSGASFDESITDACSAEFAVIDANDDGRIDQAELRVFLESAGLSPEEARRTAADMDTDGDDVISREEYLAAWRAYYLEGTLETETFLGGAA
ncbi:EF-hand domain-containing protein [Nonomuraea rhizosphaerae]|uniref:EF-hand domain-containing protein n=1 Tax=Nonomuraea rhizosphaerae TaxID=2665663 RepID=UPI001C5E48A1|nr:EF-hand domain-containing protein [Nonomuraea rhizosphaerae]